GRTRLTAHDRRSGAALSRGISLPKPSAGPSTARQGGLPVNTLNGGRSLRVTDSRPESGAGGRREKAQDRTLVRIGRPLPFEADTGTVLAIPSSPRQGRPPAHYSRMTLPSGHGDYEEPGCQSSWAFRLSGHRTERIIWNG